LDKSMERRREDGSVVETAEGLALTANIRTLREEMEADENRALEERGAAARLNIARTKLAVLGGTLVSFAILFVAFRRLRVEVVRRRESEHFLDSIVENLPNMVFVKEAGELRFRQMNRAGEELLGVSRADLVGKNDFDLFPREQAEFFQKRDRETLA